MPIASNLAALVPKPPSLALAARLSGGDVSWFFVELNSGTVTVAGVVEAPAGLGADDLRSGSICAVENGAPLVAVMDSSALHILTTGSAVTVSQYTETMAPYSVNQAWGILRDGGRIYQWMYGEDGSGDRTELWRLTAEGRDSRQTAVAMLAGGLPSVHRESRYTVDLVSPPVVLDVREDVAYRYNGTQVASDPHGTQSGCSLSVDGRFWCAWTPCDLTGPNLGGSIENFAYLRAVVDGAIDLSSGALLFNLTTPDGTPTMVWAWTMNDALDGAAFSPAPFSYDEPPS